MYMDVCTHCLLEFVAYRRDAGACVDVAALRTFASVRMGVWGTYDAYKRETTNAICIAFYTMRQFLLPARKDTTLSKP